MARVVSVPTITAKPHRITSVSAAEPPARRQRMGWRLYAEYVARAADRMEESRLPTGFQLSPEIRNEDFNRVGDRERVVAPDLVEQLLARDHQALVAHQILEQLELALWELDRAVRARDFVRVWVQLEVAHAQRGHAARGTAPQQRAHAGEQLLALERLDEGGLGAGVQPLDARFQRVAGGQHQDRRVVAVVAQPLGHVDPVQARKAEVQDDDVRQERMRLVEPADAVGGQLDLIALQPQRALENLRDLLVVFDDEHANRTCGGIHRSLMVRARARILPEASDAV